VTFWEVGPGPTRKRWGETVTETRPTADAEPEADVADADVADADVADADADAGEEVEEVGEDAPSPGLFRARVLVPLHAAVAAVLTWPLVAHLTDSLPYGTEDNPTVQLFNLWTLRWNQDRMGHLFASYWDAPIFHPTGGTFALSEPQPLTGLVFTPISWLTGNPVLALNLVFLAILTANGWAAARLARHLGAAPGPATLVGVLAQGTPFVATQMGVLQLSAVFPLFLLIDAIVRWAPARGGGRRAAAEIGLWLAVTFLTCGYYGLFAVVGIGLPALMLARRHWLTRPRLVQAAVALAVFAVLALPEVLSQGSITGDYSRTTETVRNLSAGGADFWRLATQTHGAGVLPWVREAHSGQALYPGTALLLLGVAGFVLAYRRFHPADEPTGKTGKVRSDEQPDLDKQRLLLFLIVSACVARALSLGLNLSFGPYRLVRAVVPGFQNLRSPFRFSVLTEVFLAALAAYALDALWRWRAGRSRRPWGAVAAVVIVAVGVLEVGIMPVRLFEVDQTTPDWAAWLDDHAGERAGTGDGSIAFLPFPPTGDVTDYEPTVQHMLQALDIGAETVNGYSGLFPSTYDELENAARTYPNEAADSLLREYGVSYLVVEKDWLDPTRQGWLDGRYQRMFSGRDAIVYEAF
jgi:hypothetical protein